MPEELKTVFLEGMDVTVESFIKSRPSASKPYLISAAFECLRQRVPMNEAEVLVLAAPIYYFTLCAQIQAPIQRMYCVNSPAKVKKMALLMSSYSPNVYDGAIAEFRDICNYWQVENMGYVSAKIDEQKTDATLNNIQALVQKL
jgi:hypothetical protein